MKKEFEKDELLAKLSKSAGKTKAPVLSEDIIYAATNSAKKFGPRKLHTPRLLVSLAGGAAVLAGVFSLSLNSAQNALVNPESTPNAKLDARNSSGSALIAMGDISFTEEQLVSVSSLTLNDWGQMAVANYVSNQPERFEAELWSGQEPAWIFVVVDGVFAPNQGGDELRDLFKKEKLSQVSDEITSDSGIRGIKLLIQDQASGGALYPLVIKENPDSSFYLLVRDTLLAQTYTAVPLG